MKLTTYKDLDNFFNDEKYTTRGMSNVQMENFIFAQQITSNRVAKQFLNELQSRYSSFVNDGLDVEEKEAEIGIIEEDKEGTNSSAQKHMYDVQIKRKTRELWILKARQRQTQNEIDMIIKSLNKYEESIQTNLLEVDLDDENAEREYWVKRLSKQAGLDIATTGRISFGNMESVMSLPSVERDKVIANSVAISHSIGKDVQEIEQALLTSNSPEELDKKREYILGPSIDSNTLKLTGE